MCARAVKRHCELSTSSNRIIISFINFLAFYDGVSRSGDRNDATSDFPCEKLFEEENVVFIEEVKEVGTVNANSHG